MNSESSESLRQQFQLIQEQQQKKLLARKQRKTKSTTEKTSDVSFVKATSDQDRKSNGLSNSLWGLEDSDSLDLKVC